MDPPDFDFMVGDQSLHLPVSAAVTGGPTVDPHFGNFTKPMTDYAYSGFHHALAMTSSIPDYGCFTPPMNSIAASFDANLVQASDFSFAHTTTDEGQDRKRPTTGHRLIDEAIDAIQRRNLCNAAVMRQDSQGPGSTLHGDQVRSPGSTLRGDQVRSPGSTLHGDQVRSPGSTLHGEVVRVAVRVPSYHRRNTVKLERLSPVLSSDGVVSDNPPPGSTLDAVHQRDPNLDLSNRLERIADGIKDFGQNAPNFEGQSNVALQSQLEQLNEIFDVAHQSTDDDVRIKDTPCGVETNSLLVAEGDPLAMCDTPTILANGVSSGCKPQPIANVTRQSSAESRHQCIDQSPTTRPGTVQDVVADEEEDGDDELLSSLNGDDEDYTDSEEDEEEDNLSDEDDDFMEDDGEATSEVDNAGNGVEEEGIAKAKANGSSVLKRTKVYKDFIAPDEEDDEANDDDEDFGSRGSATELESESESIGVGGPAERGGDDERVVGGSPDHSRDSYEALNHLTRLRSRMSAREGRQTDVNRYFEALISYDDGKPTLDPGQDDTWVESDDAEPKVRKPKKNRKGRPKKAHKCETCARIFYQAKQLERHVATHVKMKKAAKTNIPRGVGDKSLSCEVCGKVFKRSSHLNRHRLIHTGEKPFICETCGDRFARPDKLRSHKKIHDSNKQYICATCGDTFALQKLLKIHKKTHKNDRVFSCETCGKQFSVYARLYRHRIIHSGKKPYLCEICGDRFTQSTDLQRHRVIHTGVKAHLCDTCGKKFYHSAHLKRHVKIHTRMKPYQCETCGGQFARSDILKRHEKIHTGEKAYKCDTCAKLFTRSSHLQRHMVIHTGTKRIVRCKYCTDTFSSNERLRQHTKFHHPLTLPPSRADTAASGSSQHAGTPDLAKSQSGTPASDHLHYHDHSSRTQLSTPDPGRQLQSPGARSYCSEPATEHLSRPDKVLHHSIHHPSKHFLTEPFTGEQLTHFNHHLGLQPHQGFFPHQSMGLKFDCLVCGEQFPSANLLEIHTSVHTAEKHFTFDPSFVPQFNRHFEPSSSGALASRHQHYGQETYRCEICGERFSELTHFQLHCIVHTGEGYAAEASYGRQFTQFPYHNQHSSFPLSANVDKRDKFDVGFRQILGDIPQPQNLSLAAHNSLLTVSQNQVPNPSCQKQSKGANFMHQLQPQHEHYTPSHSPQPCYTNQQRSPYAMPQIAPYPTTSQLTQSNVATFQNIMTSQAASMKDARSLEFMPQFLGPYRSSQMHLTATSAPSHIATTNSSSTSPPPAAALVGNVAKKPVSIMNNLPKPKKRPRPTVDLSAALLQTKEMDTLQASTGILLDGLLVVNPEVNVPARPDNGDGKKYKCGTCGDRFETPEDRIVHVKIHIAEMEKKHECRVCQMQFVLYGDLKSHMKEEHTSPEKIVSERQKSHYEKAVQDIMEALSGDETEPPDEPPPVDIPADIPAEVFACTECAAQFPSESALRRHAKLHTPVKETPTNIDKDFVCDVCFRTFCRPHHLARHKRIHTGDKPFKCEHCDVSFSRSDKLSAHAVKVHGLSSYPKKEFRCGECDLNFDRASDLKQHNKDKHADSRNLQCNVCNRQFSRVFHLKRHRKLHQRGARDEHICEYCNKDFRSEFALNTHVREVHDDEQTHQCGECDAKFVSMQDLSMHRSLIHLQEPGHPQESGHSQEPGHPCDECAEKFFHVADLSRHKRRQHSCKKDGDGDCQCELCGKKFNSQTHLRRHEKTHNGEKPYMCETCGDKFSRASHLQRHKIRHTGEKEFKCETCGAQFSRSDHLLCHQRTHLGSKPFVCEMCGLQFASQQGLKGHMTTHTGEKPYICTTCNERFARNSHLVRHRSAVHNDGKSFTCEKCGKSFNRSDQLKRHSKIHTGEKPHVCMTCGKAFSRPLQLQRHEKTHREPAAPAPPRVPISMMDWPKWSDYPTQFPLTGSILHAAMAPINSSHVM